MSSTLNDITLTAPDISCGHRVATVKCTVGALPGVAQVEADPNTKHVAVSFEPNQVSLDQIEPTLDEACYPVKK
jgi:copper chaperone